MKFDDSPLKEYLLKHLQPLTPADPAILADYIIALLKKDKPLKDLQDLCVENLVEFLGQSTQSFVSKLFIVIQDGPVALVDNIKVSKNSEPPPNELEQVELKPSKVGKDLHLKEEEHLLSETGSDSDELEVSDDDDDRNHKHRKRGARHLSFQQNVHGRALRKLNRKSEKTSGDRKLFDVNQSLTRSKYENNSSSEKSSMSKFEKKYPGTTSVCQAPQDIGPRARFRNDPLPRFDSSASASRPAGGRGRGRVPGPWSQHDSRFGSLGTLDFASHMIPQASTHPGMFIGATISSVAAQPASWGAFGFIPGMGNGCLDPVNPLGLPGPLHSQLNPQLNLSIPHQRCRDFEEQGFCLRGDMCPMEHGVNRIVVEDVQSLSQFNLPVSLPSSRVSAQAGPGSSAPITSTSLPTTSKSVPCKTSKSSAADEALGFNGALSSAVAESDVYDPDQPLWNNSNPERSNYLPVDPSRDVDDKEIFWDGGDPSEFHRFKPLNAEHASSSVRDMVLPGREQAIPRKTLKVPGGSNKKLNDVSHTEQAKGEAVDANSDPVLSHEVFAATTESNHMYSNPSSISRFRKDKHNAGKTSQKALRTLFVNGIPQKNNKREALFSHFKKFGTIVDIYIPMKSEKAFVQFSSREEAEAALKAPDAVMGNRFIKLFWANRDNLSDKLVSKEVAESVPGSAKPTPLSSKSSDEVKESSPYLVPKKNIVPLDTSVTSTVPQKTLPPNTSKILLTQKKRESLEALKEELRRKQESLAKKRNEFRSQLDKLEKQTLSAKKSGPILENAAKKQKLEKGAGVINLSICQSGTYDKEQQNTDGSRDMSCSESKLLLTDSKIMPLIAEQSPKSSSRNIDPRELSLNGSKADNVISFRILPPLPASLANLSTLEEHFSPFQDFSLVELEGQESSSNTGCLEQFSNCSAIIKFATRDSAEKAFLSGTNWQGHDLKFSWMSTSNFDTIQVGENHSGPSTIEMLNGAQSELLNRGSSLPSLEADTNCRAVEIGEEHQDDGSCSHHCEFLGSQSTHESSLLEKCMLDSCAPTIEDDKSLDTSQ